MAFDFYKLLKFLVLLYMLKGCVSRGHIGI